MSQRQNVPGLLGTGTTRRAMAMAAALVVLAGTPVGLAQSSSLTDLGSDPFAQTPSAPPTSTEPSRDPIAANAFDEDAMFGDDVGVGPDVSVDKYDLVDLHVNDEDLGRVLQLLSIHSQRNIIASKNVAATITADLYGVTFYDALDAILHVNGYGYIEQGNFIYVYTSEEIDTLEQSLRKRVTKVITLDYLNAIDAAEFVSQLLSADGGTIKTSVPTTDFGINDSSPVGADSYAAGARLVIFDFEENVEAIIELIDELDTKPVQVLVEATILQTSLTEDNAFGVDFSILNNIDFADFAGSGGPLSVVNGLVEGISEIAGGGEVNAPNSSNGNGAGINSNYGNVGGSSTLKAGIVNEDVAVFLRLLDEVTDVTVVSNPKILTLNRQPARVLVGTRVGYLNTTTTETSTSQTVEFLDTGTQLALRPFVAENGMIRLELKPQVSNFTLRETVGSNGSPVTIPDEETTEMVTNVMVRDSQTVVLGGLFTETTTATRRQVPFFGDIPVIGAAFRGHEDNTRRSEIIFMITPSIVNDTDAALAGDRANDYMTYQQDSARRGLLPWSRERRSAQLLIRARELANEGDTERALHLINRALRLHPQNARARAMKAQISGEDVVVPSKSLLDGIWGTDFRIAPGAQSDSMGNPAVHKEVDATPNDAETISDSESADAGFDVSGKIGGEQTGDTQNASIIPVAQGDVTPEFEEFEESFDSDPIAEFEDEQGGITEPTDQMFDDGAANAGDNNNPWIEYVDVSPMIDPEVNAEDEVGFGDAAGFQDNWNESPEAPIQLTDEFGQPYESGNSHEANAWNAEDETIDSFFENQLEAFGRPADAPDAGEGFGPAAEASPALHSYPESVGPFFSPFFPRSVFETGNQGNVQAQQATLETQLGLWNASNQAQLDMFGAKPIDGLSFDNQQGAAAQWGQSNATGPILGPILAPAGSEVLWIPIPDGRMLRIPLVEGDFEVLERGYPIESEQFADVPTEDEIND